MENYHKLSQYIDSQKADQNVQQLLSTMSEVQEIFLYLQTHTNLSIIRSLAIVEQHIKTKEGKNIPDLLKAVAEEYPELKIIPIYCSAVNHFSRHFPAAALAEFIKTKAKVLKEQDFHKLENRIFLKVQSVDWEKIFTFMEDHYFLLSLWNFIKVYHPEVVTLAKKFPVELAHRLHNYIVAEEVAALGGLTGKTKENKGVYMWMTSEVNEAMKQPVVESFDLLKDLALQENCSIEELGAVFPEIKAALEKVNFSKISPKKVMLQKLLEFIQVEKGDEGIQFLILHDLLKLLYPYKFTPDATFLEDGPIFNKNGSIDGEVRRKKIREVKMIMDIPVNGLRG
jgi:hypothetical protein